MFSVFFVFLIAFHGTQAFKQWNDLKATWCHKPEDDPEYCFRSIPRTTDEAEAKGWKQISENCRNTNGQFFGFRYIYGDDITLSPLYDKYGIIAGIQTNLPVEDLFRQYNPYHYCRKPVYQLNKINGIPVYSETTYFVEPVNICWGGRSKSDLKYKGTAERLYFQEGPTPAPKYLVEVPLYRDEAAKLGWTSAECIPTMGHHNYYMAKNFEDTHCTEIRPSFLLFNNNGELHGFGQSAVGNLTQYRVFEHPDSDGIRAGLGDISSECMLHISEHELYSNVHFYLMDSPQTITCKSIEQTKPKGSIYLRS